MNSDPVCSVHFVVFRLIFHYWKWFVVTVRSLSKQILFSESVEVLNTITFLHWSLLAVRSAQSDSFLRIAFVRCNYKLEAL